MILHNKQELCKLTSPRNEITYSLKIDRNPSILLGTSIPGGSADNIAVGDGLPRAVANALGVSYIPDVTEDLLYKKLTNRMGLSCLPAASASLRTCFQRRPLSVMAPLRLIFPGDLSAMARLRNPGIFSFPLAASMWPRYNFTTCSGYMRRRTNRLRHSSRFGEVELLLA